MIARRTLAVSAVLFQALASGAALAQSAPPTQSSSQEEDSDKLAVIVVTAQRRSEDLEKAALDVKAISGRELQDRGITQTEQLSTLTAGLEINPSAGPYTSFSMRSVSALNGNAFADPAVAVNYNGVYLANPTVIHGLYYDLASVEILKGPQGTLYGRNATAGAININPNRPNFTLGGNAYVDAGNYDKLNFGAVLNAPLSDTVALRIAGQRLHRNGYMSDGTNDDNGDAARISLLIVPTDDLSILLTADMAQQTGKGPGATIRQDCSYLGRPGVACFLSDPYTSVADLPQAYVPYHLAPQTHNVHIDGDYFGGGLNIDWKTTLGTVTFIGGYRKSNTGYEGSGTSWLLLEQQHPRQASAELRLASADTGPLQYVVGAYYLDTSMHAHANGENPSRSNFSDQRTNLTGWTAATFGQLTYHLTDRLRATAGVRYTHENKASDSRRYTLNEVGPDPVIPVNPVGTPSNVVVGSLDWDRANWKAGLEFDLAPDSLLYANVSTAFKAGGFFYGPPSADTYQPEAVTNYAVGIKNRLLDSKLQLNAEAFYLDYKDEQVSFVKLIGSSATLVTANAGRSHAEGLDLDLQYLLTPNTRIGAQVQNLKANYDSFAYLTVAPPPASSSCRVGPQSGQFLVDCSGNTPLHSPKWTVVGNVDQTLPLPHGYDLIGEALVRYETQFQSDVSYIPETQSYATTRLDLGLTLVIPGDRYRIKAYVDNVTDAVSISNATASVAYSINHVVGINLLAPRTFGVRLSATF